MSEKFLSVKIFRGTTPDCEAYGEFAGEPAACFRIATKDDTHVKCFHVSEPPFDVTHLEDLDRIKGLVIAYIMLPGMADAEVELVGAKLAAEYKITEGENGEIEIERIK